MLKNEPEKIKTIIEMYNKGHTYLEISNAIISTPMTVCAYINKVLLPNKLIEPRIIIKGKKGQKYDQK